MEKTLVVAALPPHSVEVVQRVAGVLHAVERGDGLLRLVEGAVLGNAGQQGGERRGACRSGGNRRRVLRDEQREHGLDGVRLAELEHCGGAVGPRHQGACEKQTRDSKPWYVIVINTRVISAVPVSQPRRVTPRRPRTAARQRARVRSGRRRVSVRFRARDTPAPTAPGWKNTRSRANSVCMPSDRRPETRSFQKRSRPVTQLSLTVTSTPRAMCM